MEFNKMKKTPVTIIKLGGSVVTDKTKNQHFREDVVRQLASEMAEYFNANDEMCLIGHGQGSFGHPVVKQNRQHFVDRASFQPQTMAEMLRVVSRLHELLLDELVAAGLPATSFRLSQQLVLQPERAPAINVELLDSLFDLQMIPVTTGDVVVDSERGNRVLSTETIFLNLINHLVKSKQYQVERVVYVTQVQGVLDHDRKLIAHIHADEQIDQSMFYTEKNQIDVTGSMKHKVEAAQTVARMGIPVAILSPAQPVNLTRYLRGEKWVGTSIE